MYGWLGMPRFQYLLAYFRLAPKYAHYLGVTLDAAGQPIPENIARAAKDRVMIRIELV